MIYNLSPSRLRPVLNLTEMASLWHLPHAAAGIQGIAYTSSKRIVPLQSEVNSGVLVGDSRGQGRSVNVSLSVHALRGNIGMVAKTQSGKSNLMAILANDVIQNDPDATVILIDPHRSLAQKVASLIPPEREAQTIYWSLADRERPFGLNLIDRMPKSGTGMLRAIAGASAMFVDKRVSDVIDAFNEIWPNNWGPRMEDYIRGPLLTMAAANDVLVEGLAFEDWHIAAHAAFVANKDQIVQGSLDEDGRRMIEGTCQTFRALKPPSRPSRHKVYKLLDKGFDLFERTLAALPTARPTDTTANINTVRQLYTLLCVEHVPERRPERGAGLSARLYETEDGKRKPLQYTLLDVNPMLANSQMRLTALGGLNDEEHRHIKDWWKDSFDNYLNLNPKLLLDMVTPVRTKMNRFRASDIARRIFGQPESTIDLPKLVQQGGLLIVDLASGVIGQETAALIGSAILNWIASIIFAQQETATASAATTTLTGKPRRIVLIVDEFQSIPGADYAFMLSELGKYGVQLCLGTQSLELLDQLNSKTRRAWLNNTSSLFVFRSGGDDARELARELSIADEDQLTISPSDIVGLPEYSCFARVRGVSTPFRIDTRKAGDGSEATLQRIREASRAKYGRDAKLVDYWLRLASDL
ncbi:MAG: DUF87 domain-containing protein, partial [Anaerolineae bacterium]|nr:DUF87 domain-containing protein [Anaerolineae bacterium]